MAHIFQRTMNRYLLNMSIIVNGIDCLTTGNSVTLCTANVSSVASTTMYVHGTLPQTQLYLGQYFRYLDKNSYQRDCLIGSLQDRMQQEEKFYHHSVYSIQ